MSQPQETEKAAGLPITQQDAEELTDVYTRLAKIYARIAGAKMSIKTNLYTVKRDPNRPKRPPTAYLLFSQEKRPHFVAKYEGKSSQEIASEMGRAWRAMSASEREEYEVQAKALKEQFFKEIDDFNHQKSAAAAAAASKPTVSAPEPATNGTAQHSDEPKKPKKKKVRKVKEGDETPKKKKKSKPSSTPAAPAAETA
ncbi:High mobility group [Coemansia brasiliensis]|uniref:High mobility group n=1 Tax=Coemansia brasiliensis TaxID=2650707 RepID=A0A9W8I5R9_9FUNG|nr:High mobility group [Coemansia brasiliensis]